MSSPDAEVRKYLADLPGRLRSRLARVVEREAQGLADAIRDAAPADRGTLKESVRVERGNDRFEKVVEAGGALTTDDTGYDHALAVEFGTRKMPAEPFFWPTVREHRDDIAEALQDEVDAVIEESC